MKRIIADSDRLKALVELLEDGANSDFDQMLFFAAKKRKTTIGAYRLALDNWIKDRRTNGGDW